jgi:uncharacterized membrane protein YdjX (TVP38/TMEM64 family)
VVHYDGSSSTSSIKAPAHLNVRKGDQNIPRGTPGSNWQDRQSALTREVTVYVRSIHLSKLLYGQLRRVAMSRDRHMPMPESSSRPSARGKFIVAAVFLVVIGAFYFFDLMAYLSLDMLKANRDKLLAFTEKHYAQAVLLFILLYIAQTAFSLPGATLLTLTGGFLFGTLLAALYVNIGATTGATLAFLAARYLFRDWVEHRVGDRLEAFQGGFARNAFLYLLTLRLIPIFPFFVVNLLSGLTRISVGTYVAATALGIIPGSLAYTFAGRQLGTIDSLSELASPRLLLAFTVLGLLFLMPVVYRKFVRPQP